MLGISPKPGGGDTSMRTPFLWTTAPVALACVIGLSACAVAPVTGPSFVALPGPGKSYEQFGADDAHCRQTAAYVNAGTNPSQAATNSAIGSATVGTGVGAAAGALLGAAAGNAAVGAAAGAGAGLLVGSAAGVSSAQSVAAGSQRSYDVVYAQCMAGAGEIVPDLNAAAYAYPAYGYPGYPYPYYGYGYGYPYVPPVSFGFSYFSGFNHWH
jgi:hypothetical protein